MSVSVNPLRVEACSVYSRHKPQRAEKLVMKSSYAPIGQIRLKIKINSIKNQDITPQVNIRRKYAIYHAMIYAIVIMLFAIVIMLMTLQFYESSRRLSRLTLEHDLRVNEVLSNCFLAQISYVSFKKILRVFLLESFKPKLFIHDKCE